MFVSIDTYVSRRLITPSLSSRLYTSIYL